MVKIGCPSMPFFHRMETTKMIFVFAGTAMLWLTNIYFLCGSVLVLIAFVLILCQWLWLQRGWRLAKTLGLKEFMIMESNLKIIGMPKGKVFETHLQASMWNVAKYLLGIKKRPDFRDRTAEMKQSYFDDYHKIANYCRSYGGRAYIIVVTHPSIMDLLVKAFETAGFKTLQLGYNIDPGAKLGKLGWWLAQVSATGYARSKKPPEKWLTGLAIWEGVQ